MIKVFLKRNEEKRILSGHPWVFANEVSKIEGKDKNGSLVEVYSFEGRFLGKGYINYLSKILVRIFIFDKDAVPDKDFFVLRIRAANEKRSYLGYTSYRAVFAESDDLPALIVDRYEDALSVQFLSLGMDKNKDIIVEALKEVFNPKSIYERSDSPVREKEGLPVVKGLLWGEEVERVVFDENGVKMVADLKNGQKTGYFLDQKENRLAIRRYCKDKTVLDCFCNSGGFSINAAKGGAKSVTAVDISQTALDDVKECAKLNGFENIVTEKADVFELLRRYKAENKTFDVIILDPPAFAKSANDTANAVKGYKDINVLALKLLNKNGVLVSSSCSHHVGFNDFFKMLTAAAKESGKRVECLEIKTQSPDHPSLISAEETLYLKFFILRIL